MKEIVNSNFKWDDHHDKILKKAHQMLGFTKRTCHFIIDARKDALYTFP